MTISSPLVFGMMATAAQKPAHRKGSQVDAPRRLKVHPGWARRGAGGMGTVWHISRYAVKVCGAPLAAHCEKPGVPNLIAPRGLRAARP